MPLAAVLEPDASALIGWEARGKTQMTHDRIDMDSEVMFGKPVIKGTRITVEQILRKLAARMTVEEILGDHPHLLPDDIYAAAAFAAEYLAHEDIIFADGQRL